MGSVRSLYQKTGQRLDNLRLVEKFPVFMLIYLAIGGVAGLVMTHFRGPDGLPYPWGIQACVWAFLGVCSVFWSERRRAARARVDY